MPETLLVLIGVALAGALVLAPLRRAPATNGRVERLEAALLRHRVALEALRDLDADRRSGAIDEATYAAEVAEAERRAAVTETELETTGAEAPLSATRGVVDRRASRAVAGAAALVGILLVAGSALPVTGLANPTLVNEQLAAQQRAEEARQERIGELLDAVSANPRDAAALSDLADAYLAGSTSEDLVRAAVALQLLIDAAPERADAYERLIGAYVRAGDYANAGAALASYRELPAASAVEIAFLEGLIALRGEGDTAGALAAFDRFLELAPDDPRAGMIRALRDEAASDDP